jgi:hypothetical protein
MEGVTDLHGKWPHSSQIDDNFTNLRWINMTQMCHLDAALVAADVPKFC